MFMNNIETVSNDLNLAIKQMASLQCERSEIKLHDSTVLLNKLTVVYLLNMLVII
jgi:hypothetical protein